MTNTVPIPNPPNAWPVVGHSLMLDARAPVHSLVNLSRANGPIFALKLIGGSLTIVSNHELVDELCDETRFDKKVTGALYNIRDIALDGLFTAHTTEPNWQKAHNILMPAFSMGAMANYFPMMLEIADEMVARWERLNATDDIDVPDEMVRLTLDTIGLCGFDYRFNSFSTNEPHPFVESMLVALQEAMDRAVRLPISTKLNFRRRHRYDRHVENLKSVVDGVIRERKAGGIDADQKDLLSLMLQGTDPDTGEGLSDENIRYQIITFLIAGHETTSGLLSFALYEMLKHPAVMARAYQEVDEVFGPDTSVRPTLSQVGRLRYMRQILNEALRLYPPAPAFTLMPLEDTTLGGQYAVRKRQPLLVLTGELHRDRAVWGENPELFDPEHFSLERESKRPANAFKPFGNGKRACIGNQFALQEATLALGMLLQRFKFIDHTNYRLSVKESLTFKPDEFRLRIRKRTDADRVLNVPDTPETPSIHASNVPLDTSHGTRLNVLYASNMGSAAQVAMRIEEEGRANGYEVQTMTLDEADTPLDASAIHLIVCASYNGNPPDDAREFFQWSESSGDDLSGVKFCVLGLGNRDWAATYQRVPIRLDDKFESLGAQRVCARGEADARGDFFGDIDEYLTVLWSSLSESLGLAVGVVADKGDRYSVVLSTSSDGVEHFYRRAGLRAFSVIENRELADTSHQYGQSKRHISLALPEGVAYKTGDHFLVMGKNDNALIQRVVDRFGLAADQSISVSRANSGEDHLPLDQPIRVDDLLRHFVELQEPATYRQSQALAALTACPPEKTKLDDWTQSRDRYEETILDKRLSVLDLLEQFPSCALPFNRFLEYLPAMRPRYYSISSSHLVHPQALDITVSLLEGPAPSGTGSFRGVCSSYLQDVQPGESVFGRVRDVDSLFLPPADPATPIIMIGPGTGVAPFRGFVQDRQFQLAHGIELGAATLFFGCRGADIDFLYRDEFEAAVAANALEMYTAFSKDPDAEFRYVQHAIAAHGSVIWERLKAGAIIYICGDAQRMLPDVKAALGAVYESEGDGTLAADDWLRQLEVSGRLLVDAWS